MATAAAVSVLVALGIARLWDLPARDAVLRAGPRRAVGRVAAVTVDEASLAQLGPWPWPRARLAALVTAARTAGARLVVLDLLLPEPAAGDAELAAAVAAGPTVLIGALTDGGGGWLLPAPALRGGVTLAHVGFPLDHDGVLRRFPATQQAAGRSLPAVAVAAARLLAGAGVPVGQVLVPDFRARAAAVPVLPAAALLERPDGAAALRGRAVFIGASALGLGDRVVTPTTPRPRPEPGVLVHAAVTEALLAGHLLRPLPPLGAGLLAAVCVLAVAALAGVGGLARVAGECALVASVPLIGGAALLGTGAELPLATLTLTAALAAAASEGRLAWLAWRDAGAAARLLAERDGAPAPPTAPARRLTALARLAEVARRRREDEAEARRVLAHELKTPLTSMRGLAQLLAEFELPPAEQRRVAAMVGGEVERLQEMVDGILELERLEARPPTAGPVDLAEVARSRCAVLAAGGAREVAWDGPDAAWVRGDRRLLERVLDNLVGNALAYSPPGRPVAVSLTVQGAEVLLVVRDRGHGIPADELGSIFGRFVRGSSAAGTRGTGLGLALVREVVRWHGGRVEVESAPGVGSSFRVVLPSAAAPEGG